MFQRRRACLGRWDVHVAEQTERLLWSLTVEMLVRILVPALETGLLLVRFGSAARRLRSENTHLGADLAALLARALFSHSHVVDMH